MSYQKAVHNAVTGEVEIVDLSPDEIADVEARIANAQAAASAQARAEETAAAQAASDMQIISARPTDDDIRAAKSIPELKDLMLKQNEIITMLIKRAGLVQ